MNTASLVRPRAWVLITILGLAACGGSGGGGGADPQNPNTITSILDIPGAAKLTGSPPAPSPLESAPGISTQQRSLLTSAGSEVQIPLQVDLATGGALSLLYAKVAGSSSYFEIMPSAQRRKAHTGVAKTAVLTTLRLKLGDSLTAASFCVDIQAQDSAGLASGVLRVCLALPDNSPDGPKALANAGADQQVTPGDTVQLVGSGSSPFGAISRYSWSQTAGPAVATGGSAASSILSFTAPAVATDTRLGFVLLVTDSAGNVASSSVEVEVVAPSATNRPPLVEAGPELRISAGLQAVLRGDDLDRDGTVVTRSWTQTAGPAVELSGSSTRTARFVAPAVSADTLLEFQYSVSDDDGATASDSARVTVTPDGAVTNEPPVANAGADQTVAAGDTVLLSGGLSSDPDGSLQSYDWQQTAGVAVSLAGADSATPSFVAPQEAVGSSLGFVLTVTDDRGASASDEVLVSVVETATVTPQANAGPDLVAAPGEFVSLDGRASTDPAGGTLGYDWQQTGGPAVSLNDSGMALASFFAPDVADGTVLAFQLTVTSDSGATASDQTEVTVQRAQAAVSQIRFADPGTTVSEAAGTLSLLIEIVPPSETALSLPFTVGGSATAGSDYTLLSTSPLDIAAGSSSASIEFSLVDDGVPEGEETIVFALGEPSAGMLDDPSQFVLTISEPASGGIALYGITDEGRLLSFSSDAPSAIQGIDISGIQDLPDNQGSELIEAIALRPANGMIYLITNVQKLYYVDPATGIATLVGNLSNAMGSVDIDAADFDSCSGELRLLGDQNQNFRVDADTATLIARDGDLFITAGEGGGTEIGEGGLAYGACSGGSTRTAYVIETFTDNLRTLGNVGGSPRPASSGELFSVSESLNRSIGGAAPPGFDIDLVSGRAFLSDVDAPDSSLYEIDLQTGVATTLGVIAEPGRSRTTLVGIVVRP